MAAAGDEAIREGELSEGDADDGRGLGWYPQGEDTRVASAATPLDASNKGFQLLAKMGWAAGRGLGKNEDGGRELRGLQRRRAGGAAPGAGVGGRSWLGCSTR